MAAGQVIHLLVRILEIGGCSRLCCFSLSKGCRGFIEGPSGYQDRLLGLIDVGHIDLEECADRAATDGAGIAWLETGLKSGCEIVASRFLQLFFGRMMR